MEDIIIKKNVLDDRRYKDVETIFTQQQLWSLNSKNETPYLYHTSYLITYLYLEHLMNVMFF